MYRTISLLARTLFAAFALQGGAEICSATNFLETASLVAVSILPILSRVAVVVLRGASKLALTLWLSATNSPSLLTSDVQTTVKNESPSVEEPALPCLPTPHYKTVYIDKKTSTGKELLWTSTLTYKPGEIERISAVRKHFSEGGPSFLWVPSVPFGVEEKFGPIMRRVVIKRGLPAPLHAITYKPAEIRVTFAEEKTSSPSASVPAPSTDVIGKLEKASEEEPKQANQDARLNALVDALSAISLERDPEVDALAETLSAVSLGKVDAEEDSDAMEVVPVSEDMNRATKRKARVLDDKSAANLAAELFETRFTKSVKVWRNSSVGTGLAQFIRAESMVPHRTLGDFRLRKGRSAASQAAQERRRNAVVNKKRVAMISAALLNEVEMGSCDGSWEAGEAMEQDSFY
ncbi:hypothetical protein D9613_010525 [Agrocybe pediades]|uniref:Uncharacterized protein n=1 Tax=Agrocybe pediades TaxID=84607 RepID=A0A8H4VJB9_9AGAR|nr:hypothetical protein D9613_010525 [Agrocybe pediades]